jgi:hexosaminidase
MFLIILCLLNIMAYSKPIDSTIHIIPEPVSVNVNEGHFRLSSSTRIIYTSSKESGVANMMQRMLNISTGYHLRSEKHETGKENNIIILKLNRLPDTILGDEGYTLNVTQHHVVIAANKPHGLFYGMQSFMQLLPPSTESKTVVHKVNWEAPCVDITDYPRFKWRGLMLDVSRHFFTVKEVEEYINEMAKYKFNVFHWHLTDDQGWRIQIKGLPRLTEIGAWRVHRTGRWGTFKAPQPGEKATDGGYYTQEDIKKIVAYAKKRFVTILPEIDVPAHGLALIASYPNLSGTQKQYPVWPQYPPDTIDNVLDVANDSVWIVLNKIFTQIAELFPCKYIHVGGDEANRSFWMKNPDDLALMKKEGITSPAGLQSYFEKKLEKIIVSKGKRMMGWDEILEGGIAPEATVMSWRGEEGGIEATRMGHHVIMSPYGSTYLSQIQGNSLIEPPGPGMITLQKCYDTNILPEGVNPNFVLGGEGCLWTEYIPNNRHLEYMTWPRALALSEVFWGTKDKSTWSDFLRRVQVQFKYLKTAQIKYATSIYDPFIEGVKGDDDSMKIKLSAQIPGLDIYYRFDETNPDNFSPEYHNKPLSVPNGATAIKVITYRDGKPIGHQVNGPLSWLEKRMRK